MSLHFRIYFSFQINGKYHSKASQTSSRYLVCIHAKVGKPTDLKIKNRNTRFLCRLLTAGQDARCHILNSWSLMIVFLSGEEEVVCLSNRFAASPDVKRCFWSQEPSLLSRWLWEKLVSLWQKASTVEWSADLMTRSLRCVVTQVRKIPEAWAAQWLWCSCWSRFNSFWCPHEIRPSVVSVMKSVSIQVRSAVYYLYTERSSLVVL